MTTTTATLDRCSICEGELAFLGSLGTQDWFRCRACGWERVSQDGEVPQRTDPAVLTFRRPCQTRSTVVFDVHVKAPIEDADSWQIPVEVVLFRKGGKVEPVGDWFIHTESLTNLRLVDGDFAVWADSNLRQPVRSAKRALRVSGALENGYEGSGMKQVIQQFVRESLGQHGTTEPERRCAPKKSSAKSVHYSAYSRKLRTVVEKKGTLVKFREYLESFGPADWKVIPSGTFTVRCVSNKTFKEQTFTDAVRLAQELACHGEEWDVRFRGRCEFELEVLA